MPEGTLRKCAAVIPRVRNGARIMAIWLIGSAGSPKGSASTPPVSARSVREKGPLNGLPACNSVSPGSPRFVSRVSALIQSFSAITAYRYKPKEDTYSTHSFMYSKHMHAKDSCATMHMIFLSVKD